MVTQEEIAKATQFVDGLTGVQRATMIGSAAFMSDKANDVDYALLVDAEPVKFCKLRLPAHFKPCGEDYDIPSDCWTSVRHERLNLMVTNDADWFERYVRAMEVCRFLKLHKKSQRVGVCRIVRDGHTTEEVKAFLKEVKFDPPDEEL